MAQRRVTLTQLSVALRVSKRVLRRDLRRRDIGLLKLMRVLQVLNTRLDVFIELAGYYSPGAALDPNPWG